MALTGPRCGIRPRGGSPTWRTFLSSQIDGIAAIDLFTVPTINYEELYALVVLGLNRRHLVLVTATSHPTAMWLAQQINEAFPWDSAPRFLIRDNDAKFGHAFKGRVEACGIRDRPIAPRSPWQNGNAERVIGTIRRECLDQVIVLNETHPHYSIRAKRRYNPPTPGLDTGSIHNLVDVLGVISDGRQYIRWIP